MQAKIIIEDGRKTYVGYVEAELCGNVACLGEGYDTIDVEVKEDDKI